MILYETLGPTLGLGREATAVLWGAAHTCAMTYPESVRRAGFSGDGLEMGEALFEAMLARRSGVVFTIDEYEDTWRRMATSDGRVKLDVPELLAELSTIRDEPPRPDAQFPLVLTAGERRSTTANTIFRDPSWRTKDAAGALRISPSDAQTLGIASGSRVRVTTRRGTAETVADVTDRMLPGHVSLPNGLGVAYPDADGANVVHGVAPNELTSSEDRDWLAGTPWHKHVPARGSISLR